MVRRPEAVGFCSALEVEQNRQPGGKPSTSIRGFVRKGMRAGAVVEFGKSVEGLVKPRHPQQNRSDSVKMNCMHNLIGFSMAQPHERDGLLSIIEPNSQLKVKENPLSRKEFRSFF